MNAVSLALLMTQRPPPSDTCSVWHLHNALHGSGTLVRGKICTDIFQMEKKKSTINSDDRPQHLDLINFIIDLIIPLFIFRDLYFGRCLKKSESEARALCCCRPSPASSVICAPSEIRGFSTPATLVWTSSRLPLAQHSPPIRFFSHLFITQSAVCTFMVNNPHSAVTAQPRINKLVGPSFFPNR